MFVCLFVCLIKGSYPMLPLNGFFAKGDVLVKTIWGGAWQDFCYLRIPNKLLCFLYFCLFVCFDPGFAPVGPILPMMVLAY